jgi:hypothetical protein
MPGLIPRYRPETPAPYSTGLRQRFEASGYVDSLPVDIVVIGDDVTEN